MTRQYLPVELPTLKRVDGGANGRRYVTPNGDAYPSVTTVFSVQENGFLDAWRARVGEEEARRISSRAAARGTYVHLQCEHLLKGTTPPHDPLARMLHQDLWNDFRPIIDRIGDVYALEAPLYSDKLRTAGTVDCVGRWDNKLSIIDFKTSSRFKAKDSIENYWCQCAAYAYFWFERTGQPITQLVILMSVDDGEPLVYVDDVRKWLPKFQKIRAEYKNKTGD